MSGRKQYSVPSRQPLPGPPRPQPPEPPTGNPLPRPGPPPPPIGRPFLPSPSEGKYKK